jgi:hypothetical protein
MNLLGKPQFVPLFIWFERLTHFVLREYLFRVIAPELAEKRSRQAEEKSRLLARLRGFAPPNGDF